jgi:hypothetical protein
MFSIVLNQIVIFPVEEGWATWRWARRKTSKAWQQDWVVHCKPVGNRCTALKYLAPYVFRVAVGNSCLVKLKNDQVTFRYRATDTGEPKLCTLSAEAFIRRFL